MGQLRDAATLPRPRAAQASRRSPRLIARVALASVVQARAAVRAVAVPLFGLPATRVAAALGITQMPVLRGIAPGRELLAARGLGAERLGRAAMR